MHLSKLAVKRPIAVTVVVIIVLLFGAISIQKIGVDLLPDLNFPIAVVVTLYPGAAPVTVQQDITIPVEGALSGISGLRKQDSFSIEHASATVLQFNWGTDMLSALDQMRNNLAQLALTLPEDAQAPIVTQIDPNDFPLMLVGVSGKDLSPVELSAKLNQLKPQLEQLSGVAQVSLLGTSKEEIQVLFDPDHLNEIGLTPVILQQLIMYQNIIVPGGAVTADGVRYTTRAGNQISSPEELEQIIVGIEQGSGILGLGGLIPSLTYLGDVAEVTTRIEPRDGITRYNGEDTILIQIMRQSGANSVRVAKDLKDTLSEIEALHPELELSVITDQSLFINESIGNLASSGVIGGILALLVLWLFLRNFQSLFIIALSIPVSIIASFVLVYFSNLSLNLMTLGGLALGVGMLVDSSIVVLENIYRHLLEGSSPRVAAQEGAGEIAGAILASTATTIAVFLPVIFLQSIAGQLLKELGLTISYSLIASLLVALTVIPVLSAKLLKPNLNTKSEQRKVTKLQKAYLGYLETVLNKKYLLFTVVTVIVLVSILIFPRLDQEFLPSFDEGFLGVTAMLPSGLPLETVHEIILNIEKELQEIPEVAHVAVQVGDQGELDVMSLVSGMGIENAQISIKLVDHKKRKKTSKELSDEVHKIMVNNGVLRTNIADTSLFGSASSTVLTPNLSIEIRGDDPDVLVDLAAEIKDELAKVPGFRDIQDSRFRLSKDLFLKVDTSRSILGGFTAGQVGLGMRYATAGLKATDIQVGNRVLPVVLRPDSPINSVDDLLGTKITSPVQINGLGEEPILLNEVVEPVIGTTQNMLQRTDRLPVIFVTGILDDISLTKAVRSAEEIIRKMQIPAGYHISIGGLQDIIDESMGELTLALGLSVVLVFLVMAAQFESFIQPLIIMFSIPLALFGSLIGLWLVGGSVGIMSIIGIIVLAGIVVNNAIVLVDYINLRRKEDPEILVRQAIMEAAEIRLRPILMTSITTIFGLLPVALGFGVGSEFQRPLAATVMGGLITSTFLTLFVIPAIYEVFSRFERKG